MRYVIIILIVLVFIVCSCGYPTLYFVSSQGWATYDGSQRRLEIMWDSKIQASDTIDHANNVP